MPFDVGRDLHWSNRPDVIDVILRPRQKFSAGRCVSLSCVQVPDPGREKLYRASPEEAPFTPNIVQNFTPNIVQIDTKASGVRRGRGERQISDPIH